MKLNLELRLGGVIAIVIITMSLLSFFWVPYDYNEINHENRFLLPGTSHLLGTDNLGRDIFSRIMTGGRNSLLLAVCTVICAASAGCLLGLLSGYLGGLTEFIIMRIIDVIHSFPGILIALLMIAVFENSQFTLFTAFFILFIPGFTRIIRTAAMRYKNTNFIEAEKILGAGFFRVTFIHILPNVSPALISAAVIGLSNAILAEAAMSYLGMGIGPPNPSWGRMLHEAQIYFYSAPWYAIAPGIFIMLTVIAFHLLGEGLRGKFGGSQ
jgi:peptide/nickel transport system permease protein